MKPLRLEMSAFGPFGDVQVIDFEELGEHSFFLIHGPTGAGKSSVLDAMCFALYGESSGSERGGSEMRSHHADETRLTEVTFDFAVSSQRYRVNRRPAQQVPKQRGDGLKTSNADAALWKLAGDAPETIAAGVRNVTDRVTALLGFDVRQFRQVVVLPQGQFRELLSAESKDRQKILRTLFDTGHYERIEAALKTRSGQLARRLEDDIKTRDNLLGRLAVENPEDVAPLIEGTRKLLAEMETRKTALEEAADKTRAAHSIARHTQDSLDEKRKAEQANAELEARRPAFEQQAATLDRVRKAATLRGELDERKKRAHEAQHAERTAREAVELLKKATTALEDTQGAFSQQEARQPEREVARRDLSLLETLHGAVEALDSANAKRNVAAGANERAALSFETTRQDRARANENLAAAQALLQRSQEATGRLEGIRAQYEGAEKKRKLRVKLDELESEHRQRADEVERLDSLARDALVAQKTARKSYEDAENHWRSGQAANLARQLSDGSPCPVCGSPTHPNPAVDGGAVPTEAALKERRAALEGARGKREDTQRRAELASANLSAGADALSALHAELGEAVRQPPEELGRLAQEQKRALEQARREAAATSERHKSLEGARAEVDEAEAGLVTAENARQKAMADLESAGAVHKERQGAVPKELREPGALTNAIEAAQRSLQRMEAALETARTKLQGAKETHARCVESEKQTKARSVEARRAAEETARELRERLQRLGFVDEADLSTAMQSDVELDDLANRVRTSEQAVAAACDRLARARKSADGLENPDMEAHTEAVKAAQVALSEHMTALGEQGERLKQRTALSSELNDLLTANTEQEREYGVLARLAQVAAGKGSSEQNLTFERYVLSTLLEEVLVAATRRLLRMSRGRFELLRAGTLQDKRKAGGLDLEVFDAHTGHTRPVSTLSGGEGFQASLALALGLADVVQSHSGGIRLDAIFIDEGFGTLDPEMLDLAIRTLQDLQKHGRLVGIISHVPELKESIDVRLELHSSKQGSSARFVLP